MDWCVFSIRDARPRFSFLKEFIIGISFITFHLDWCVLFNEGRDASHLIFKRIYYWNFIQNISYGLVCFFNQRREASRL